MNVTLNIATLAHRPGDTIDVPDDLAADLLRGDLATLPVVEPAAEVAAATEPTVDVAAIDRVDAFTKAKPTKSGPTTEP